MDANDFFTIIGRYDDTGETTVAVLPYDPAKGDPHMVALRHTAELSERGEFEVVAVMRGRCDVLVTQQSLRLFADRIMRRCP
ncbi:hypothetical protein [Telmatospirillum sp.]|uniref:hypothetical protein n=1 Tax=Telmatospirillum sp. TaxID=2079197 RepID=UPI002841E4E0|nr:hypothetical protein [Telmatospirillum sp.]MDR3439228.1 hypothetical protein [Telmatospirillum sp.]